MTTRFAPSPTGHLHLGHAFAAAVAQRRAREHGGRFLLRFEDIDHTRVRELDENPAIITDLVRVVGRPGHNPLDMLAIALTGKTKAAPTRSSTTLSRMLGIGRINAAALDARLAPLYEYSKSEGGRYLGRAVGDV